MVRQAIALDDLSRDELSAEMQRLTQMENPQMMTGISLSEHTWANALAVLPADWTTNVRFSFLSMRAHTE